MDLPDSDRDDFSCRRAVDSFSFSRIIFKCDKDIHCPEISDEFDYGVSASLNMRIMDRLLSWALLPFLVHFSTFFNLDH